MSQLQFGGSGWDQRKPIEVVEEGGQWKLFLRGQLYKSWRLDDEVSQRIAIAQLYELGKGNQDELAKIFKITVKSVNNYIRSFKSEGACALVNQKRGPKGNWKL